MKLLLATVFASTLVATSPVAADMCIISELQKLMATPYTTACMSESGLDFSKLTGAPTTAQTQGFCKSSACASLLKSVLAKSPPTDCMIPLVNVKFRADLFDPLAKACGIPITGGGNMTATAGANATAGAKAKNGTSSTASNTTTGSQNKTATAKPTDLDPDDAGVSDQDTESTPAPSRTPASSPSSASGPTITLSVTTAAIGVAALALVL